MKSMGDPVWRSRGVSFLAFSADHRWKFRIRFVIRNAAILLAAFLVLATRASGQGDTLILLGTEMQVSQASAVCTYNRVAFVTDLTRVSVIDFTAPTLPTAIAEYPGLVFDIDADRNLTYHVGQGMIITDVSDPTEPEIVATCCPYANVQIRLHLFDTLALTLLRLPVEYLELLLINVTDPSNPEVLGTVYPEQGTMHRGDVFKNDDYVFWADLALDEPSGAERGRIMVFDISDPTDPVEIVADTCLNAAPLAIWVKGDYAYVAEDYGGRGVMVFDVSDPYDIDSVGCFPIPEGRAWDVYIKGNYAYVCAHVKPTLEHDRIYVLDISNPLSPSLVTYHDTPGNPQDVFVDDPYVLVADYSSFLVFEASFLDLPGDVNEDGIVNVGDVVLLVNFLYKGGAPPDSMEVGDVNGDCVVNVGDIVYLVNYLYRQGPCPFNNGCSF